MVRMCDEICKKDEKSKKCATSINVPYIFYFPSYFDNLKIIKKTKISHSTHVFYDTKSKTNELFIDR